MKMINKVKIFIKKLLENKTEVEKMVLNHLIDTEKYVILLNKKITKIEPSEELRIAALGHDIERAFRDEKIYEKMYKSENGFLSEWYLNYHQEKSAEIIANFLKSSNYPEDKIERVYNFILKHEVGGDFETNILKDADSISFFINNSEHFIIIKTKESSIEKVKEKLDWMYNRITFNEAKEIAKNLYLHALKNLDKLNEAKN